jgi:hypothetical protein
MSYHKVRPSLCRHLKRLYSKKNSFSQYVNSPAGVRQLLEYVQVKTGTSQLETAHILPYLSLTRETLTPKIRISCCAN